MAGQLDKGKLERALADADALPACPAVLARVAQVTADPASNARDLGNVIATDEVLTGRLIKQVNSAYYGLRGTISTVTQAVVILGYQEIKNLVYAVRAQDVFRGGEVPGGIDVLALWDHCLQVAVLAREFSYRLRYPVPEEIFVSGIIHDIGQVIMNRVLGSEYRKLRDAARAGKRDLAAAEQEAFGVTHPEVGRRLADKWNFPESLQRAVRYHHALPEGEGEPGTEAFILAADAVVLARGRGAISSEALDDIPQRVREHLGLDLVRLEESSSRADEEYGKIRSNFELSEGGGDRR